MKQKKKMSDILRKIKEAENYKDWGSISYIIDNATENNYKLLIPCISNFINHKNWLIRASAVEFIGFFGIEKYLYLVRNCLKDGHPLVRDYALLAYYDLLGDKAIPLIEKFCSHKNVMNRVTALLLHYINNNDDYSFQKLSRILKRKRCNPLNISGFLRSFDYYYNNVEVKSRIVKLLKDIIPNIPKSHWIATDVRRLLKKLKH